MIRTDKSELIENRLGDLTIIMVASAWVIVFVFWVGIIINSSLSQALVIQLNEVKLGGGTPRHLDSPEKLLTASKVFSYLLTGIMLITTGAAIYCIVSINNILGVDKYESHD